MPSPPPQRINLNRAHCLPAAYLQGAPPTPPQAVHPAGVLGKPPRHCAKRIPQQRQVLSPGWVLVVSCLFHREGQREIQHTPASSGAQRPSLSIIAASRDNRLPSQCRELRAAPRPTSTRAGGPGQTPGEEGPRDAGREMRGAGVRSRGLSSSGMQGSGYGQLPPLFLPANSPARSCNNLPASR